MIKYLLLTKLKGLYILENKTKHPINIISGKDLLSINPVSLIKYPILFDSIEECHIIIDRLTKMSSAKDFIVELTRPQLIEILINNQSSRIISTLINLKKYPWDNLNIIWESNYKDERIFPNQKEF